MSTAGIGEAWARLTRPQRLRVIAGGLVCVWGVVLAVRTGGGAAAQAARASHAALCVSSARSGGRSFLSLHCARVQVDMRMLRERPDFQKRFGVPPPGGEVVELEPEWRRDKREREAAAAAAAGGAPTVQPR